MKKIFTLVSILISIVSVAQKWKATIKAGSKANSVIIAVKPDAAITNEYLNTVDIALLIPKTVTKKPTVTIIGKPVANLSWTGAPSPTAETDETFLGKDYYGYIFHADGSSINNNNFDGSDVSLLEVDFSNSEGSSQVLLAQLPGGGSTGSANFYLATNLNADAVDVNPFYGGTAVNDGGGFDGSSYVSIDGIMLPVTWLSFNASLKNSAAVLNWSAEEKKSSHFEITRSLDGFKFTTLNKVASKGDGVNAYTYVDEAVAKVKSDGDIYYQLIQVDKDGKRSASPVRTVTISLPVGGISVAPNPVRAIATVRFNHPRDEKATLRITDANGKIVYQSVTQLQKGYNQKDINASALGSGNYHLSVISNSTNKTIKLVKVSN